MTEKELQPWDPDSPNDSSLEALETDGQIGPAAAAGVVSVNSPVMQSTVGGAARRLGGWIGGEGGLITPGFILLHGSTWCFIYTVKPL